MAVVVDALPLPCLSHSLSLLAEYADGGLVVTLVGATFSALFAASAAFAVCFFRLRTRGDCHCLREQASFPLRGASRGVGRRSGLGSVAAALFAFVRGAGGQTCAPNQPGFLRDWCFERCLGLQGWLRLRFSYEFFDNEHWEQSSALSLWGMCPQGHISLSFARATLELRQRPRLTELRARALRNQFEHEMRQQLLASFNMSMYLRPTTLSFAPFFQIAHFVQELRAYPEVLPAADGYCAEGSGSGFEPADYARALRDYVEREEVPPRTSLPAEPSAGALAAAGGRCSPLAAALVFAAADMRRLRLDDATRVERVAELVLKGFDMLRCAIRQSGHSGFLSEVAAGCVPVFELLDRLDRQVVVPLQLHGAPLWEDRQFFAHVLPTNNLESNHVRGMLKLHCDAAFKSFAQRRFEVWNSSTSAAVPRKPFSFVEVGAHLGGCTLVAATHLRADVQALAVEPFGPAAAALRRSASANGLHDVRVAERLICERGGTFEHRRKLTDEAPWTHQPAWVELPGEAANESSWSAGIETERRRCSTLDSVLDEYGVDTIDLLRVHVLGEELSVLRSAATRLRSGAVRAVAIAVFSAGMDWARRQDAPAIGRLLRENGFEISYEGREGVAAEAALAGALLTGTSTLLAWQS